MIQPSKNTKKLIAEPSYNRGGRDRRKYRNSTGWVARKSIIAEPAKSADAEVCSGNQATRSACLIFKLPVNLGGRLCNHSANFAA